jgi:hypothetical protein
MSGPVRDPRRRGVGWRAVGHRIKVPSALDGRPALLAELRAWQAVLPASAAWTALTGAAVHELWLPSSVAGAPRFVATGIVPGEVHLVRRELAISRHVTPPTQVTVDELVAASAGRLRARARCAPRSTSPMPGRSRRGRPCCEALRRTVPSDPGPWLAMVAESLYDAAGRRAFLGRLHQNWRHLERH